MAEKLQKGNLFRLCLRLALEFAVWGDMGSNTSPRIHNLGIFPLYIFFLWKMNDLNQEHHFMVKNSFIIHNSKKCFMCIEKNMYSPVGCNVPYICWLGPFGLMYSSSPTFSYSFSICIIYPLPMMRY